MTEAEQIFEKHIGLNTELGYLPYKKEDIIDAINEALIIQRVSNRRELLIDFKTWETYSSNLGITIEDRVDIYLEQKGNL